MTPAVAQLLWLKYIVQSCPVLLRTYKYPTALEACEEPASPTLPTGCPFIHTPWCKGLKALSNGR